MDIADLTISHIANLTISRIHYHMYRCLSAAETAKEVRAARVKELTKIQNNKDHRGTGNAKIYEAEAKSIAGTDLIAKAAIQDNQWFMQQTMMWAAVLQAEISYHKGKLQGNIQPGE